MPTTHSSVSGRLGATALIAAAAVASLTACDREPTPVATLEAAASASASPASASPAPTASPSAEQQCAAARPLLQAVPREFVGSAEHVALFDAMIAVAPSALLPDLKLMRDHYIENVSPADPPSQDFVNFPADVQEAALALTDDLQALCALG